MNRYHHARYRVYLECKPRTPYIPCCLPQVCSVLHQRYAEFGPALAAALPKLFIDDGTTLSRRRATLRLLTELMLAGVAADMSPLLGEPPPSPHCLGCQP